MVGLYCLFTLLLPLCESTFYSLRAEDATGIGYVTLDQYQGKVRLTSVHGMHGILLDN